MTGTKTREGNARLHAAPRDAARAMFAHAPACQFAMWARGYLARHCRAGKSKAVDAPARRIGKALYYCHLKDEPFDDSGYRALLSQSGYRLCPVEEMGFSPGVVGILKGQGLHTSRQVVEASYSDPGRRPGCGRVTVAAVAGWIDSQEDRRRDDGRKPRGRGSSTDLPAAWGLGSGGW